MFRFAIKINNRVFRVSVKLFLRNDLWYRKLALKLYKRRFASGGVLQVEKEKFGYALINSSVYLQLCCSEHSKDSTNFSS